METFLLRDSDISIDPHEEYTFLFKIYPIGGDLSHIPKDKFYGLNISSLFCYYSISTGDFYVKFYKYEHFLCSQTLFFKKILFTFSDRRV